MNLIPNPRYLLSKSLDRNQVINGMKLRLLSQLGDELSEKQIAIKNK